MKKVYYVIAARNGKLVEELKLKTKEDQEVQLAYMQDKYCDEEYEVYEDEEEI